MRYRPNMVKLTMRSSATCPVKMATAVMQMIIDKTRPQMALLTATTSIITYKHSCLVVRSGGQISGRHLSVDVIRLIFSLRSMSCGHGVKFPIRFDLANSNHENGFRKTIITRSLPFLIRLSMKHLTLSYILLCCKCSTLHCSVFILPETLNSNSIRKV